MRANGKVFLMNKITVLKITNLRSFQTVIFVYGFLYNFQILLFVFGKYETFNFEKSNILH